MSKETSVDDEKVDENIDCKNSVDEKNIEGNSASENDTYEESPLNEITHESESAQLNDTQQSIVDDTTISLPAFHQKFSGKFFALAMSILMTVTVSALLFYLNYQQSQSLITTGLTPIQRQADQLHLLQKNNAIVEQLLQAKSDKNWLELHDDLVATNRQLLRLNPSHAAKYKKWLNQNTGAKETVERVQKNQSRNQQLKQSSIIQLQLMLFTTNSILDKKTITEKSLYQQLQTNNASQSRVRAYAKLTKQLHVLNQLKILLVDILTRFENLSINTAQGDFDLLRLGVEQVFVQAKLLAEDNNKAVIELLEQVNTFRSIVLTEQSALAKWQGHIRLAQSYNLDLQSQTQQIDELLLKPQVKVEVSNNDLFSQLLAKYNIKLSNEEVMLILSSVAGLLLLVFFYYLARLRQQLKRNSEESFSLITQSIHKGSDFNKTPNCAEAHAVIKHIQLQAKPEHDEQDYQKLLKKYQTCQQLIDEQKQLLLDSTQSSNIQEIERIEQVAEQVDYKLHSYQYLKTQLLTLLSQSHIACANELQNDTKGYSQSVKTKNALEDIYETLEQFELSSYMHSNDAVLTLENADFIEVLHCTLFNKQDLNSNAKYQLYINYDKQINTVAQFDVTLFQTLCNVLFDLVLDTSESTKILKLHAQLADKNAGQQIIRFNLHISDCHVKALPKAIALLVQASNDKDVNIAQAQVFKLLLEQLHGENITAQLVDGGYQLSFNIPLAFASSEAISKAENRTVSETSLAETKTILLSANTTLQSLIKQQILAVAGKFEEICRFDSFTQIITPKYLTQHKLDLLIVGSDIAELHLEQIKEHIANLPESLKPKVMVLQSPNLCYQQFGCYSQAEQPLCQTSFIANAVDLLTSEQSTNEVLGLENFQSATYQASDVTVLLAVNSVQQYQDLQRLLTSLGLKVVMVCGETSQRNHWQTGRYSLLLTEFNQSVFVDMFTEPVAPVGVFSLTEQIPTANSDEQNNELYRAWQCEKLSPQNSLSQLEQSLAPWLNPEKITESKADMLNENDDVDSLFSDMSDGELTDNELAINEVAACLSSEVNAEASFDFSRYLKHQGSVALALFMLDDYSQDNHQQLANLAKAIKEQELAQALEAVKSLQLNAKILSSKDLEQQCQQWLDLLSDDNAMSELKQADVLLKDTQQVLHAIDSYAETV